MSTALRAAVVAVVLVPLLAVGTLLVGTGSILAGEEAQAWRDCRAAPAVGPLTVEGLDPVQADHVVTIVAVGLERGVPRQGLRVALATAAQESRFLNYANDGLGSDLELEQRGVERSQRYPHDAVGTDHGSVNVFQQQYPWWGTLDELMDPRTAAGKFYDALLEVEGWQRMPVTVAAQTVQRSAFPNAYAQWEQLSDDILSIVLPAFDDGLTQDGARAALLQAGRGDRPATGDAAALSAVRDPCAGQVDPAGFRAPVDGHVGHRALETAASWIGTPYAWGGGTFTGPSEGVGSGEGVIGFDCSGLVLHAWYQAAGVQLPHSSALIAAVTVPVPVEQAQAGDILSFATTDEGIVSHDGIYDGWGGMIHAPRTGETVEHVDDVLTDPYWGPRLLAVTRPEPGRDYVGE